MNKKGGRAAVALSDSAEAVLRDKGVHLPTDAWFVRFYAVHEDICEEKLPQRESVDRAKKHNDTVLQNHFYSPVGLKAELVDAGVMDAATGERDGWRVGFLYEAPKMSDSPFSKGGGRRKHGAMPGRSCHMVLPENRECPTVNMMQLLSGFMLGPQIINAVSYTHLTLPTKRIV
eukprot:TRINITY_DN40128_c0_g1_i2.p1 TRINITY_DN40128_c0_g1~~TRINITY_DN40128_c0_g1_i2.p1  ORF type:complete len:174 (-),score=41.32 TRINITY_DN40128_c0_g1_i2:59-580(-)